MSETDNFMERMEKAVSNILIEKLNAIEACNIFYTSSHNAILLVEVSNSETQINIKLDLPKVDLCLPLCHSWYLKPNSVSGVIMDQNSFSCRVQLNQKTALINLISGSLKENLISLTQPPELQKLIENCGVCLVCKQCHQKLGTTIFSRVRPLPSSNWDQISETWFCHRHGNEGDNLKPAALNPGQDECFYDELSFRLHRTFLDGMSLTGQENQDVCCDKCRQVCGHILNHETIQLWSHRISWLSQDTGQVFYVKSVTEILATLFSNIDRDNFGINCRLVLALDCDPKRYLYMVTIDTNLQILLSRGIKSINCDGHCKVYNKDHIIQSVSIIMESDHTAGQTGDSKSTELSETAELKKWSSSTVMELRKLSSIKLLYAEKIGDDNESGDWVDDVHVHILPCCQLFFAEVHQLLVESNSWLPPSLRLVDGLHVGYIPL